jgi:GNAT superfamily N-acetyltransferase
MLPWQRARKPDPSEMDINIRESRPQDLEVIVRFNSAMASETEGKILEPEIVTRGVKRALEDPERSRYFLAEVDGRVVGQIMFTLEWSDWRDAWFWWIQSVFVDPEYRGGGVFSRLYRFLYDLARNDPDVCGLRLYVETDNGHAQNVYHALGMQKTGYLVMETLFRGEKENHA